MNPYLKFLRLVLTKGSLRDDAYDFNTDRAQELSTVAQFVPASSKHIFTNRYSKKRNSILRNLRGQVAYIKSAVKNSASHLTTETLAYIRIPKSANTSVSYAMLSKIYPELTTKTLTDTQINFLADVNLKPAAEASTELFFTVVRDPFKRLVSVYRDFFETHHNQFIYQDYLFGILPKEISFAEFVDRLSKIPDRLKDQHLKPQHYFLNPYQHKKNPVAIFQLEDSEKLTAFLHNHSMELTHRNKSGEAYDYTTYYTPALLEQVYTIYRTDIEKLGYAPAYEHLKSRV